MSEQKTRWVDHLEPRSFAESANRRFVGLAGLLFRAVSWRRPIRGPENAAGGPGQGAPGNRSARSGELDPAVGVLSLNPRALAALAKKVDDIVKRSFRGPFANSTGGSRDQTGDPELELKLRELFHQDAWHRLAAARWLGEHRCKEAISTLEGVLSIEESDEVRNEIERTLAALGVRSSNSKGDPRCSRSSEVSL